MPLPVPLTHCPRLEAGTSWVLNPDTSPDPDLGLGTSVSPTIPRPSLEAGVCAFHLVPLSGPRQQRARAGVGAGAVDCGLRPPRRPERGP